MAFTPWYTSNDLINAVKRKIAFPLSQNTYSETDILAFANEEMIISQIPSVMMYHEEYFVYSLEIPIKDNTSKYPIPDRAIGLKLRDVFFKDASGNLQEMTRVSPDDRAYWQSVTGQASSISRVYLQGNDLVLTPDVQTASGSLVVTFYLRPNQLVINERACIAQFFTKTITCSSVIAGDTVTIDDQTFTAVASGASSNEFNVGGTNAITATNLASSINTNGVTTASATSNIVTCSYSDLSISFSSSGSTLTVQTTQGIQFDQVPITFTDSITNVTESLFTNGSLIDFLQTKPGHKTYNYDVQIPSNGISGTTINFNAEDVPENFIIGDYICLANECIIPQIPPDLHNSLAEYTCNRILAAMGDQAGVQSSNGKLQDIQQKQGTLIDNRIEGAPQKITARHSLSRYLKRGVGWRL